MSDLCEEIENEDLYDLMQDDFDPAKFYKALSNALEQLENYDVEAA